MPGSMIIDRDRTQAIPEQAREGMYTFYAYVGAYPAQVWSSDQFDFEKLAVGDGPSVSGWGNWGESFAEALVSNSPLPSAFAVHGTYPNPFNPVTALSFTLPEAVKVSLKVYDISGRLVATLVDGFRDAGIHEVTFDASHLSSGIYLYRLNAGDFSASGKMVLMK